MSLTWVINCLLIFYQYHDSHCLNLLFYLFQFLGSHLLISKYLRIWLANSKRQLHFITVKIFRSELLIIVICIFLSIISSILFYLEQINPYSLYKQMFLSVPSIVEQHIFVWVVFFLWYQLKFSDKHQDIAIEVHLFGLILILFLAVKTSFIFNPDLKEGLDFVKLLGLAGVICYTFITIVCMQLPYNKKKPNQILQAPSVIFDEFSLFIKEDICLQTFSYYLHYLDKKSEDFQYFNSQIHNQVQTNSVSSSFIMLQQIDEQIIKSSFDKTVSDYYQMLFAFYLSLLNYKNSKEENNQSTNFNNLTYIFNKYLFEKNQIFVKCRNEEVCDFVDQIHAAIRQNNIQEVEKQLLSLKLEVGLIMEKLFIMFKNTKSFKKLELIIKEIEERNLNMVRLNMISY